jgi:hypothetical protein
MDMDNAQDILERMRKLEEENARLRGDKKDKKASLVVTEGEYMGHPVLTFEGPGKRFSLGLKKLRAVQEAWPQVEKFLKRHKGSTGKHSESDDDLTI